MSDEYFLMLGVRGPSRIVGNSKNRRFPDWIEIDSFSHGSGPANPNAWRKPPPGGQIYETHFSRLSDDLTPLIFSACHRAEYFDAAILAAMSSSKFNQFQFNDVLISRCQYSDSARGPLDSFTISYTSMNTITGAALAAGYSKAASQLAEVALLAAATAVAGGTSSMPILAHLLGRRGVP